jgi:hypothetical protein
MDRTGKDVPAYRRRALRAAPHAPSGRSHAASIPDAFGRRFAPCLCAALALSHACFCGWSGLLFPSSLHTVLAVKVCAHFMRWRPLGRLRTCDCCAAAFQ